MKILDITSRQAKRIIRTTLSEKLPFFMGKVSSEGIRRAEHPLAESLYSVITFLYKGQDKESCSEKRMIQACSDHLYDLILEWHDQNNFIRFCDIPHDILSAAIWQMECMLESSDELKAHLLPTHLKNAIKDVCGGNYSQAMFLAFQRIESGLARGEVPLAVWNAALKIPTEIRKNNLGLTTKELTPCATPISNTSIPPFAEKRAAMIL